MKKSLFTRLVVIGCVLIAGLLSSNQAKASHAMGADLSYECIDPATNTYKITLRFYRDCFGIDAPTSVFLDISSSSCGQSLNPELTMEPCPPAAAGTPCEVSPLCPSAINQSTCNGGTYPGVQAYTYSAIVQLPANCPDWIIAFDECCRNQAITNLLNPDSEDLYIEAHLNNANGLCNSSPVFTTLPVPFICANQPFSYNHGAVDADGDSLVYTLVTPLGAGGITTSYAGAFSPTNPMNTSPANTFTFSNNTGQMFFTPNGTQVAVVTVLVEEYRNGVLIGSTMRDIQFVVVNLPGCANPAPVFTGAIQNTLVNGIFINSFNLQVCPGNTITFNTLGIEPGGDSLFLESNIAQSIPGAQYTSTYLSKDSIYSQLVWTPTALDTGNNIFIVTVKNNNCPLASNQAYAINITVLAGTYAGPDLAYCPAGGPVQLQAYGGSQFTWTPSTSLDNPNISNPKASPAATTEYIVTSNLSNNCKNKDTVVVYRVPDFSYTITQSDDTICRFEFVNFNVVPDAGFGPYTYNWTPAQSLNATNIPNPVAQPDYTTTYTLVITSDTGCVIRDTTTYVVVQGQGPAVKITADKNKVCVGDTIQLDALISTLPCGLNVVPCVGNFDIKSVGTGSVVDQSGATPYRGFYMDSRVQILYRASELQALGMQAGTITDIAFDITQAGSTAPYDGFTIKMGCTDLQQLSQFVVGLPTVMGPVSYVSTGVGTSTHTFDTPYDWDGISNLIVEICFDNNAYTQDDLVKATTTPYNSMLYAFQDNAVGCNLAQPNVGQNRPNIQFIYCVAPPKNLTYNWTPTTGLAPVDSLNPKVILNSSTTYYLNANDGSCSGGGSITLNIDTSYGVSVGPDVPICSGIPVQLNATITGTPPVSSLSSCGTNSTACSGTPAQHTFTPANPFSSSYTPFDGDAFFVLIEDERSQMLYQASDLIAAGYTSGTITQLAFNVLTKQSITPFENLSIKMGCTNKTTLDDNGWEPTTLVYGNVAYSTIAGWNTFNLQAPFDWDGSSNLVIEICWDNPVGSTSVLPDYLQAGTTTYNAFHTISSNNTSGCALPTPTFTLGQEIPALRVSLCPPPPKPITYLWSPATNLTGTTIPNPVATPAQPTTYVVTTLFGGKCPRTDTITITPASMNFSLSGDTGVCEGHDVTLTAGGGTLYNWNPATGLSCSDCASPVASPANSTVYYVTVTDANTGCVVKDSVVVNVQNLAVTALYGDTLVDQGTPITIGATVTGGGGQGSYVYNWQPATYLDNAASANPVSTPISDVLYTLTVTSGPCSDTTSVNVRVNIIESPVKMPNAFTPNGDGHNDGFYPVSFNVIAKVKTFRIYNRYGELVHDGDSPWDGTFKGKEQPSGTYVYYIVISRPFKDDEKIEGSFALIR